MSAGVIFYFERHDRGGIYPLNTFSLPANSSVTFDSVSYHLDNIFAQLITESLDQFIWVEDRADFNPNEGSGYGPVYSELEADENFKVTGDAYTIARQIAEKVVGSDFWVENIGKPGEKYVKYHENGVKFKDIPKTAPALPTAAPVDPRFQVGDRLVAFLGRDLIRYTYAGVHHDPLHADYSATDTKVDNANRTIWLGVKVNRYVKEADVDALLAANKFEVHPVPYFAVDKRRKWFARSKAFPNLEGVARTQKAAKEELVVQALVNKQSSVI
jgi:hypothetical protein